MDDESLAKVMAKLEQTVGKDRVSEIRREAAKRAGWLGPFGLALPDCGVGVIDGLAGYR